MFPLHAFVCWFIAQVMSVAYHYPGNELIQYNPSEDLSSIFDLQDIAPVTQTDDDLTEQNLEEELNTPQVTPLAGDSNRLAGDYGKLAKGGKTGLKIKQEMEDID